MKLSRDTTLRIHTVLDQCLPPFMRDSKLLMLPLFKLLFGSKARFFMNFKDKALYMTPAEFKTVYREAAAYFIYRKTDLNEACLTRILNHIVGSTVLDVACGRGFLAGQLSSRYHVTAADIFLESRYFRHRPDIRLQEVDLVKLPFHDGQFDTVISSHTLEHVPDIAAAASELRRVASRRLIIVVPRQRAYRYTFDLHLHFFPYDWSLQTLIGTRGVRQECHNAGGDWFYVEDY